MEREQIKEKEADKGRCTTARGRRKKGKRAQKTEKGKEKGAQSASEPDPSDTKCPICGGYFNNDYKGVCPFCNPFPMPPEQSFCHSLSTTTPSLHCMLR